MTVKTTFLLLAAISGVALAGCNTQKTEKTTASTGSATTLAASKAVNTKCPYSGQAVNPSIATVNFKGKAIGFCCAGCATRWQNATDTDRAEKLAASMPK
jgi:hypothetical protein